MGKRKVKEIAVLIPEEAKEVELVINIKNEADLDAILASYSDGKVSFGRLTFSGNRGPFLVAFPDTITRDYAEMNALDFKSISINDIKLHEVQLWECGVKTQEGIDALPKINIKELQHKKAKDKEKKKQEKAEKLSKSLKEAHARKVNLRSDGKKAKRNR